MNSKGAVLHPNNEQKLHQLIREQKYQQVKQQLLKIKNIEFTNKNNVFTALQLAVLLGRFSLTRELLDLGADPETRGLGHRQLTPLQLFAKYGHSDIAELLVNWAARENGIEGTDPPLHTAAYHGQLKVFNTLRLLTLKADINSQNGKMGTLLHSICAGSWSKTDSTTFTSFDNSYSTKACQINTREFYSSWCN